MNPVRPSSAPSTKAPSLQPTPEEVVALALNEQGYLFQHKLVNVLQASTQRNPPLHNWEVEASEVPVSLPNGKETRIDIVLRRGPEGVPWRIAIECKRAARDYKRWVFFAENEYSHGPSPRNYYTEKANLARGWDGIGEPVMWHGVETAPASSQCPVFDFGIEARIERPDKGKRASATDAIEEAFQQVTLGQTGLALKLRSACVLNFRLIPLVVTTAELMSANFNEMKVSLDRGMIDSKDLKLCPKKWLAVNCRVNDVVCESSRFTSNRTGSIADYLALRQVRTVFVVQSEHIESFLAWLETGFLPGQK